MGTNEFKPSMPGRLWRFITSHWLVFIFCFSALVRLATIATEPYWYDESFTAFVSDLKFPAMLQAIAGDTHPPIWYLLSWVLSQVFGSSSLVLRAPAALFSALAVPELYKLIKKLIGNREALIGSGLMAVLPGSLYYGQEARMYSLLTLLVLFAVNGIMQQKWLRVALAGVLLMFTHNMAILYALPLGVWSLISSKGKIAKYWYLGLAYVPWIGVLQQQIREMQSNGFWIVNNTPGGMLYFLEYTTFFNRLPAWAHWHGALVAIALTVMSLWSLRGQVFSRKMAVLAGFGFLPVGELYVIGEMWRPMMLDRLMLPSGSFIVALWAAGFVRMSLLSKRIALTLFVPILTLAIFSYYTSGTRTDYGIALQPIRDQWRAGDTVYHNSLSSVVLLRGQLPDDGYILPGIGDLSQALSEPTKAAMGIKDREILPPALADMGYKRLWVLYLSTPVTSQHELDGIQAVIDDYPVLQRYDVGRDLYVTFEVILLDITHETKKPDMLPLPSSSSLR